MRKKLLSLLLTLAMVLSLCPAALAAEDGGDVRETDFFTEQTHADMNYEDMEYEHIEAEPILAEIDAVRELLDDASNAAEVEERFNALTDEYLQIVTMYKYASLQTSMDVTDEYYRTEKMATYETYMDVVDALCILVKDILNSDCDGFLRPQLTEEDIEYYLDYEEMTQEEKDRSTAEMDLEDQYDLLSDSTVITYEGQELGYNDIYYAYLAGEIDRSTYLSLMREYLSALNAATGEVYVQLVELRKEEAAAEGYDNYSDYAYDVIYQRDYTPEEIRAFHAAVKENLIGLSDALYTLSDGVYALDAYAADYTGDIALDMMEPYIAQMSSELLESFTYMREHGLYFSEAGDHKDGTGYSNILDAYGAPIFFNTPNGNIFDFTTAVHEFGHYNNFYWQPCGWNDGSKSIDLAEVHSQGLELLFSHWYSELFGEGGDDILLYQMNNLVGAIIDGSLYDELQQYVYSTDNVTLEQINAEYLRLNVEYGYLPVEYLEADDGLWADIYSCQWVLVPHNFQSPLYYISYATSASGAFAFWLAAQEGDYFDALDEYLRFTALDVTYGFQDSFETVGVESPISAEYVEDLAAALWTALDIDARLEALQEPASFSDVTENNWFYDYVMFMVTNGLIDGYEDGTFRPNEPATWYVVIGEEFEGSDEVITRGEFCQVVAEMMGLESNDEAAAVEAMVGLGVIGGYPDGTLRPEVSMTRAEFCAAACRAAIILASQTENAAA